MPRFWRQGLKGRRAGWLALAFGVLALSLPRLSAAAPGPHPGKAVNVADTRGMAPGLSKLIADVYNESHVLFAVLVVLTMAATGLLLSFALDRAMRLLGLELGKLDRHE